MVRVIHVRLMLPLARLLLLELLGLELIDLLSERVVLRHEHAVRFVALGNLFLVNEKLRDDLIHSLIVRAHLRSLILFDNLAPVHVFELVAHVALANDRFKDFDPVAQFSVLRRQMEVFIFASVDLVSQIIDIGPELSVRLHELLGEVHRLDHPVAQRLRVQPMEQRAALALRGRRSRSRALRRVNLLLLLLVAQALRGRALDRVFLGVNYLSWLLVFSCCVAWCSRVLYLGVGRLEIVHLIR